VESDRRRPEPSSPIMVGEQAAAIPQDGMYVPVELVSVKSGLPIITVVWIGKSDPTSKDSVAGLPLLTGSVATSALTAKSATVTMMICECWRVPDVPVTFRS